MRQSSLVSPILKWVGGKRQLLPYLFKNVPEFETYFEPFVGGGALLFEIKPESAVINDVNEELINLYNVVKTNVEELIIDLKKHKNDEKYFYTIRELDRDRKKYNKLSDVKRASRMIYLNKTCYNGLFRVNKMGEFNSPFGSYSNPKIAHEEKLRAVNKYFNLADIKISCIDFEKSLESAKEGDFVYLDPPYDPVSGTSNFTSYDKGGFGKDEQRRLKTVCDNLEKKGVKFLLSNSATDFILDLYKEYSIKQIRANRAINSNPKKRGAVYEVLVRNYE